MDSIKVSVMGISFRLKKKRPSAQDVITNLLLRRNQDRFWALRRIDLRVERGEVLGVIGANGSGKSTLLRALAGIYRPHEGAITVKGRISALLTTTAGFQADLTGIENIYMNAILSGFDRREVDELKDSIIEYSELGDFVHQPVRTYSSGMFARLGFSIAIHAKGDVLLVDEVLGAGDERFAVKARASMDRLLQEGRTVVLVSHNMEQIHHLCHRAILLNHGHKVADGSPEQVIGEYRGHQK